MNEAEARDHLAQLVASSVFPTLTPDELTSLLVSARIIDRWGVWGTDQDGNVYEEEWEASTAYAEGDVRVPTLRDGFMYVVSQAGTSGASEPTWDAEGTTTDGTVEWEYYAEGWQPTHDFNRAAAAGWELKASKVSDRTTFAADGGSFNPQQVYDHCLQMADRYRYRISQSVHLRPASAVDDFVTRWRLPRA